MHDHLGLLIGQFELLAEGALEDVQLGLKFRRPLRIQGRVAADAVAHLLQGLLHLGRALARSVRGRHQRPDAAEEVVHTTRLPLLDLFETL